MPGTEPSERTGPARLGPALLVICLSIAILAGPAAAGTGGRGTAGSSGDAGVSGPPVRGRQPAGSLPGIDVSHHQDAIDWAKVAAHGERFVIAKATEGQTFDDPMYASYKAGAGAQGLAFTAYHFARPDATANDAILEADHFVDVAQLGPGNLVPALDIERTGGLDQQQLTDWVLAWLGEVTARLGVRPMIYTSPKGWDTRFGDTTAIADAGYMVLWVAHWNVSSPTVPANDWAGNGWTFWQHTDCANMNGISGCVDHDWYDGTSFAPVTIRGLTVSVSAPDGVVTTSPARFTCSSTCSANFEGGSAVTLTATPNAGAVFLGWGGACTGTGTTCALTMDADQSVTASFATDVTPPTVTFTPPSGLVGPVTATFSERVHNVTGSNLVLRVQGGSTNLAAAITCRSPGGAIVSCSTGNVLTVSLKPDAPLALGGTYTALVDPPEASPLVDSAGNPAATTAVDLAAPIETEQDSPAVRYGWRSVSNHSALGGSYVVEHLAGASASFAFRGNHVTWYTVAGPEQGLAEVTIDGRSRGTVNGYDVANRFHVTRTFGHLGPGAHTITITALGRKGSPKATDRLVAIDGFAFGTTVVRAPELVTSWRRAKAAGASGGTIAEADLARANVSIAFRGTGIEWYTALGPDQGRAQVFVDGTLVKTTDNYAPDPEFDVQRSIGGLTDGSHTLRIVVLGESRRSATGTTVSIDRFVAG